jgi:zona occludens toxin (predicted ATPase)
MHCPRVHVVVLMMAVAVPAACGGADTPPPPADAPPAAAAAPTAAASAPSTPVSVQSVELGSAVNPDKTIAVRTNAFKPGDTVYVSVRTMGTSPSTTLSAKWTYGSGELVNESVQTIAPTGPAMTEFHISKPDGLREGPYRVDITVNGMLASTSTFSVAR